MSALTILSIFVFFVVLFIFLEYRNEKKYQKERRRKQQKTAPDTRTAPSKEQKKATPKPEPKPEKEAEPTTEPEPEIALEPEEPQTESIIETKQLPEANYPPFTHVRLVEMGLSDEEAKEFVAELIPQIETEIPLIEAAIEEGDFHKIEKLTHGIKGSATNLGTGGVSDLLTDYNTYVKTGTDVDITNAYLEHLKHYTNELKAQYT
ncbi:Hpt domain-containing protein [Sulfurovum sp. XGS-02]|uniref:Hpt domain-containing protein n=1 Tax=Sulfurovum sp. XGS-02 TaxID=2925411 RepID=UPI002046F318|nr:Hpt domain-containing protein [Sulfurovum sp. XGS-02]UPT76767.1 Hpt domain-containing protein [Sulfurovum sp. XGS-02]